MIKLVRILTLFTLICILGANEVANKLINLSQANNENPTITGTGVVIGVIDGVFNPKNPVLAGKHAGLISNANANNTPANEIANKVVRLDKAKEKNPTIDGTGIVVGILDGPYNLDNPILSGKAINTINNRIDPDKFVGAGNSNIHGTQVASIIVGNTNSDLTGVASGAKFFGLAYLNPGFVYNTNKNNFTNDIQTMIKSGAKVFNHSYASDAFPLINRTWGSGLETLSNNNASPLSPEAFRKLIENDLGLQHAEILANFSKEQGILNIVGAGNDGFISTRANSVLPSYDESYRGLLVAGGVNPNKITVSNDKITLQSFSEEERQTILRQYESANNNDSKYEKIVLKLAERQGIYYMSNLFKNNSLYALVAPAQNLVTANAKYGYSFYNIESNKLVKNTDTTIPNSAGTSFATPYVSSIAALVQQKFPFLKGSQIGDVLLTTANKNVELPNLLLMTNVTRSGGFFYTVVYTNKDVPKTGNNNEVNLEEVENDLVQAGFKMNENDKNLAEYIKRNLLKSDADVTSGDKTYPISVVRLSKEEIIGSGLLDAQNALKGLAALDINRLNPSDLQEFENADGNKKLYAFYTIDTQGQNGQFAFTNDISEIKWDDKYHIDEAINSLKSDNRISNLKTLEAGFVKTGQGTFKFEGNTLKYNGPTVASGGILELNNVIAENTALYADKGGQILISGQTNAKQNLYAINGGEVQISGTLSSGDVYALNGG
ncbi:S8 family peptidase, partial [Helicobacter sp. 10-6591]|uniref:S8 family peptidase n=1 Tax=Helicobacter sp. 10-6591 TaxID=2004998 RepID=UPI000DCD738A